MLNRCSTACAVAGLLAGFASGVAATSAAETPTSVARAAPAKPPVLLPAKPGGWSVAELCSLLTSGTGRPILLDRVPAAERAKRIECTADVEVSGSRLFAWVQAVLAQKQLALVPVGPQLAGGERTWQLVSQCDPIMISSAIGIDDDEVLDYADRDGLYVVTTLRIPDGVDTTRMRNALSPLCTQTAGLGRLQDVPGSHSIVVIDFAPVVASMKRAVDAVGAATPAPGRPPAFD